MENIAKEIIIEVDALDAETFKRLDAFLIAKNKEFSRTYLQSLFKKKLITATCKLSLSKMPAKGTRITIQVPTPIDSELRAQNIPLEILYEDKYLLILNKAVGMVVHPAPGNPDKTLVNALLYHCDDLQGIGDVKRPGIVHRLDKGTSGVMVVAKDQKTHELLSLLFQKHDLLRKYEAISFKGPQIAAGKIETLIGRHPINRKKMTSKVKEGKKAITFFRVLERFGDFNHVELTLETGRTHQIRVHLSEQVQASILNDQTYANVSQQLRKNEKLTEMLKDYEHPFLHAKLLSFIHPITKEKLEFSSKPPQIFTDVLEELRR
jgi:23S rRNA pseudouridine1911/1915/1917 synthase